MDLAKLRTEYASGVLNEADVDADPIHQFTRWLNEALAAGLPEPHAMTLATATPDGAPSARIVLLRGADERGFAFYTNYLSRKGHELTTNPRAALVFYWQPLERQVRIEGTVEKVKEAESDTYFYCRPVGSQLAACASAQSEVLPDRITLEKRVAELTKRYAGQTVPRPAHWGGFRVRPEAVEFWQGRLSRVHDRLRYRRGAGDAWMVERLSP